MRPLRFVFILAILDVLKNAIHDIVNQQIKAIHLVIYYLGSTH